MHVRSCFEVLDQISCPCMRIRETYRKRNKYEGQILFSFFCSVPSEQLNAWTSAHKWVENLKGWLCLIWELQKSYLFGKVYSWSSQSFNLFDCFLLGALTVFEHLLAQEKLRRAVVFRFHTWVKRTFLPRNWESKEGMCVGACMYVCERQRQRQSFGYTSLWSEICNFSLFWLDVYQSMLFPRDYPRKLEPMYFLRKLHWFWSSQRNQSTLCISPQSCTQWKGDSHVIVAEAHLSHSEGLCKI